MKLTEIPSVMSPTIEQIGRMSSLSVTMSTNVVGPNIHIENIQNIKDKFTMIGLLTF